MSGLRVSRLFAVVCAGQLIASTCALAQQPAPSISWEVKNRFRLFVHDSDFERQVSAHKAALAQGAALPDLTLKTEQVLARQTNGRGWARDVSALCIDGAGRPLKSCRRDPDGALESYINPESHFVELRAVLPSDLSGAQCSWTIDGDPAPEPIVEPCSEPIGRRFGSGAITSVKVVAQKDGQPSVEAVTQVLVRDILIVGIGDSIAAGEGNPDKPIALGAANEGFCFRRALSTREYAVPMRAGVNVIRACGDDADQVEAWEKTTAGWMSKACHRSLYAYQTRAAIALAIEYPQIAVTYVPLGCTGAQVTTGLLEPQLARERRWYAAPLEDKYVEPQITQLRSILGAGAQERFRKPDLIFLTIGANDIGFSGLVADIMFDEGRERTAAKRGGGIVTPEEAASRIAGLKENFKQLRTALRRFTDGDLKRVVFVSYFNPTRNQAGEACRNGRRGFDIYPTFSYHEETARRAEQFIRGSFFPTLKRVALCEPNGGCGNAASDTMAFVDGHQDAFEKHGVCAADPSDPVFDSDCFKDGDSFNSILTGLDQPLRCGRSPADYRAYASRQRWIRSPNDSFFSAMTYPAPSYTVLEPTNIHDALWAVMSAVYGGAIHPTAEGQAAMADAALVAARTVLGLPAPQPQGP